MWCVHMLTPIIENHHIVILCKLLLKTKPVLFYSTLKK